MEIIVERKWPKATYTIGNLYVDGEVFCNTLEDTDRGLWIYDSLETIRSKKVYGETAIPKVRYLVQMDVLSPKYSQIAYYKKLTKGYMPRLKNVPGFEGVLIHPGNGPEDTLGCILVGRNLAKGVVLQSRNYFEKLYKQMKAAHDKGEHIFITIK
ncbi:MAG: hypothetical protein IJ202_08750 [Bacteroidales bacterium]|nr:hypothetical protein [Bacteroidales bacterium]